MEVLVLGLVLFLGMHSTRLVADGWRTAMLARLGEKPWKGLYTLVSVAGLVLIVWGYGAARHSPVVLWSPPPVWVRHVSSLLTLAAFVLLVASHVPGNQFKAKLHHPMVLGVKLWAFAHLIANNTLADLLLFGSFLAWAVLEFRSLRRRDAAAGKVYVQGRGARTAIALVVGVLIWAGFAFWAHSRWIGVSPMGV